MNTAFEPVMAALFAQLQTAASFPTSGRRVIPWNKVSEQPALFLRRIGVQDVASEPFTITTLECEVWIYCNAGQDPDQAPDSALTILEEQVRDCLAPGVADDDGRYTLGGLAYWCRVEGIGRISPGDLGPQAIAVLPIRITLP